MFYLYYLIFYIGLGVLYTFGSVYLKANTVLTAPQVTMLMSFVPIVSFISQNAFAYISDKAKQHKLVLGVALLMAGACSLFVYWNAKTNYMVFLFAIYLIFAFFYTVPMVLSENFTLEYAKQKQIPYGRIRLFGSLGYAISGQIANLFIHSFGLSIIFYLYTACMVLALLLVVRFPQITSEQIQTEAVAQQENLYRMLLKNKSFLKILLCSFFIIGSTQITTTFFGIYVTDYAHLDLNFLGYVTLVSAGTEIPMMFYAHHFIERYGTYKVLALAAIVSGLRFLAYVLIPTAPVILLATATHGIGYGAAIAAIMHLINKEVPAHIRAVAISLNNSLAFGIGTFVVSMLGSIFFNAKSVYLCLFALEVVGFLICLPFLQKKKEH